MKAPALILMMALLGLQSSSSPLVSLLPSSALLAQETGAAGSSLDYEVFKTRVQPIFMATRKGHARCITCHAAGGGNSYLEPLAPGSTAYTEEQTRRNFERVSKLVVPGQPLKSLVLINPLATEAGGSHWHGGGKHWESQDNPEWQTLASWVSTKAAPAAAPAGASGLNYEVFKTRVQPIFMATRKGHARCITCHAAGGGNSYLEPLAPGSTAYTEEQTRRNFERVSKLVVPGQPLKSLVLINPLATEAGGSHWHGGGKHWETQDNPEWQTLAAWVRGN